MRTTMGVFESVMVSDQVNIQGRQIMLSHFPYRGDHEHTGERYVQWRLRDEGLWLIHGHVHDEWKINGHQINVGWDDASGHTYDEGTARSTPAAPSPTAGALTHGHDLLPRRGAHPRRQSWLRGARPLVADSGRARGSRDGDRTADHHAARAAHRPGAGKP